MQLKRTLIHQTHFDTSERGNDALKEGYARLKAMYTTYLPQEPADTRKDPRAYDLCGSLGLVNT